MKFLSWAHVRGHVFWTCVSILERRSMEWPDHCLDPVYGSIPVAAVPFPAPLSLFTSMRLPRSWGCSVIVEGLSSNEWPSRCGSVPDIAVITVRVCTVFKCHQSQMFARWTCTSFACGQDIMRLSCHVMWCDVTQESADEPSDKLCDAVERMASEKYVYLMIFSPLNWPGIVVYTSCCDHGDNNFTNNNCCGSCHKNE